MSKHQQAPKKTDPKTSNTTHTSTDQPSQQQPEVEIALAKELLGKLDAELQEAKKEAEMYLLQLHKNQERLEFYRLKSEQLQHQVERYSSKLAWLRSHRDFFVNIFKAQQRLALRLEHLNSRLFIVMGVDAAGR